MTPPPIPPDPRDESHLDALKICYYLSAGLNGLGLCFMVLHFMLFHSVLGMEGIFESSDSKDAIVVQQIMGMMVWVYGVIGAWMITQIVLNFLTARAIAQRHKPLLVQITAGINCLSIPLGTVLGVFTYVILARPAVHAQFKRS